MRVYHLGPACLRFLNAVVLPDEINTALDDAVISSYLQQTINKVIFTGDSSPFWFFVNRQGRKG